MTPKKGSALATNKSSSPKRTTADTAKKKYLVQKTSLSNKKNSVGIAQDEPQAKSSEELDALSDDKKSQRTQSKMSRSRIYPNT